MRPGAGAGVGAASEYPVPGPAPGRPRVIQLQVNKVTKEKKETRVKLVHKEKLDHKV